MDVDVSAQGMPAPGAGFAEQVSRIDAFKVFVRALPSWAAKYNASVSFTFRATAQGVEIDFGLPERVAQNPKMADEVIERLQEVEKMMQLELLVDQMRNAGVGPEVLDPMINQANELAKKLFPTGSVELDEPNFDGN